MNVLITVIFGILLTAFQVNGKSVDLEEFVEDLKARSNDEVDPPSNDHDEAKRNEDVAEVHNRIPCFQGGETDEYKMRHECMYAHNHVRKIHGVSDVTWDATLAKNAKIWATQMASDQKMYHSQFAQVGENVAYNMYGVSSPSQVITPAAIMILRWYNEIRCYDFAKGGRKSSCDSSEMIGHMTAMLWKGVKKIGCGLATSPLEGTKHKTYLACQYSPVPNVVGQYVENVLPPVSGVAEEQEAQDLVVKKCCDYMSNCKKYSRYCNNASFGFVADLCAKTCQPQCQ